MSSSSCVDGSICSEELTSTDESIDEELAVGTSSNMRLPFLALAAYIANDGTRVAPRPTRIPFMTGIQWVEEKLMYSDSCYKMFRTSTPVFLKLHEVLVSNYGLKSSTIMCLREALAIFLWTCGSPQSHINVQDRFAHSPETISRKFGEVLECLFRMSGDIIKPKDPMFSIVHPRLRKPRFWPHFRNCIGAIDGTHIPVTVPKKLQVVHTGRHGYPSQNVLALCDFDMRFTFVAAGWAGSVHDTRILLDTMATYNDSFPHPPPGIFIANAILTYTTLMSTNCLISLYCDFRKILSCGLRISKPYRLSSSIQGPTIPCS